MQKRHSQINPVLEAEASKEVGIAVERLAVQDLIAANGVQCDWVRWHAVVPTHTL